MHTAYALEIAPEHLYRDHPEHPERLEVLQRLLPSVAAERLETRVATRAEVGRVHSQGLIDGLESASAGGEAIIDMAPTYVTSASLGSALLAAGGTLECVQRVLQGEVGNAFAIVRPPGHHAEPDRSMGFCLLNNVGIAAASALEAGLQRVAIVDYDAHHGNGTQAAFQEDARVAYLSTHQWGIYPGTGWYEEAPHARGRIVNIPLPSRSGDRTYARLAEEVIRPFIHNFRPDLLLVSAGFDAHWNDPLTSLGLSTAGFHLLSRLLVDLADEVCQGRIVFVLEGGYDPVNLANGCLAVFAALMHRPLVDPHDASPHREPDAGEHLAAIRSLHGF